MIITKDSLRNTEKRAEFVKYIDKKIYNSTVHYARANDGGVPEKQRAFHEDRYQKLTDQVEEILKGLGINIFWAGLYPSYLVNDRQEHNLDWAIKEVLGIKE
jgi:hypothetical protein